MTQDVATAMQEYIRKLLDGEVKSDHVVLGPNDKLLVFLQMSFATREETQEFLDLWNKSMEDFGVANRVYLLCHDGQLSMTQFKEDAMAGKHEKKEGNEAAGFPVGNQDDSKRGRSKTGKPVTPGKHEKKNGDK